MNQIDLWIFNIHFEYFSVFFWMNRTNLTSAFYQFPLAKQSIRYCDMVTHI